MAGEAIEMVTGPEAGEGIEDADLTAGMEQAEDSEDGGRKTEGGESEEDEKPEPEKEGKLKLTPEQQRAFDKRVGKEVRKAKEAQEKAAAAESELKELRQRADGEDAEAVLKAATEAGVMPEILTAAEAKGLADYNHARANAKALGKTLRASREEELEIGGKTYTRAAVVDAQEAWEDKAETLGKRFGGTEAKAREKGLEVWRLGLAARRAGWKPGEKKAEGKKAEGEEEEDLTQRRKGAEAESGEDEGKPEAAKRKAVTDTPGGGGGARPGGKPGAAVEVRDERSLAAFIEASGSSKVRKF